MSDTPPARREVRVDPRLFDDLDAQLGTERGPNGEPAAHDFLTYELLDVVERFATGFDELPEAYPGRDDYRVLIRSGTLVSRYAVVGYLHPDGTVVLIRLHIDEQD